MKIAEIDSDEDSSDEAADSEADVESGPSSSFSSALMKTSRSSAGCTTFHPFSELPVEVRRMIWELARPEGRYIGFGFRSNSTAYSPARVPTLLHVCAESRNLALTWYELSFPRRLNGPPQTYFDPSRDGILYKEAAPIGYEAASFYPPGLSEVQRVVFEYHHKYNWVWLKIITMRLKALNHVIFVHGGNLMSKSEISLSDLEVDPESLSASDLLRVTPTPFFWAVYEILQMKHIIIKNARMRSTQA
ncbi:hypothetical protein PVAG01_05051 [Phlyctema vagabunda]|uniref:2EXR domain-containing protein n=1 Tax=Phlyctema vagabunda TaxID=108571 RepID=A0ABR4PIY0_9HELO